MPCLVFSITTTRNRRLPLITTAQVPLLLRFTDGEVLQMKAPRWCRAAKAAALILFTIARTVKNKQILVNWTSVNRNWRRYCGYTARGTNTEWLENNVCLSVKTTALTVL